MNVWGVHAQAAELLRLSENKTRETNEPESRPRTENARTGRHYRLSKGISHKGAKRLVFFLASCRDSCSRWLQVSNTCTGCISTSCKKTCIQQQSICGDVTPAWSRARSERGWGNADAKLAWPPSRGQWNRACYQTIPVHLRTSAKHTAGKKQQSLSNFFPSSQKHKFLLEHPAYTTQPQFIQKNQKKPSAETTQPHLSHLPTHPCQLQSGRNGSPSAPIVHACHHAGQLPKRGTFPPTGPQHAADESSRRKADPTPSTHPRNRCGSRFAPVQDTAAHHCRPLSWWWSAEVSLAGPADRQSAKIPATVTLRLARRRDGHRCDTVQISTPAMARRWCHFTFDINRARGPAPGDHATGFLRLFP